MPRTDVNLDAMLRHLGAAYYESLHGRASGADVTRALDTVEEHLNEQGQRVASGQPRPHEHHAGHHKGMPQGPGGWDRKVRDVMTTSVVTVDRITPYKEIARLLTEHRISGIPVLQMGREVAGVVTEADLLAAQTKTAQRLHAATRGRWLRRGPRHPALTAGEMMSAPPVTISPDATLPAAARLMCDRHVRRLPVVDAKGKLVGLVSRRDLLSVFLRPDSDVAADVRELLDDLLPVDPASATATVRNGVVAVTGSPQAPEDRDLSRSRCG